jgi:hypothetical protein
MVTNRIVSPPRTRPKRSQNVILVLNVAGPRASKEPNVAQFVIATLDRVFDM